MNDLSERTRVTGDELGGRISDVDGRLGELGQRVGGIEGHLGQQKDTLAGMSELVDGLTADVAETFERLQGELLSAQAEVLDGVRGAHEDAEVRLVRARELLDGSAAQVESRAGALEEQLAEALERVAERVRAESDEANAEMRVAARRLDSTFQHLRHLESSLVAYLEARDRRLEQDRARVLHDVLGALTDGLSKRERRKHTANLEQAIESLPAPSPPPERAGVASVRPALADLLGEDFGAPEAEEAVAADEGEEEPEVVPVPPRKRAASTRGTSTGASEPPDGPTAEATETAAIQETAPDEREEPEGHVCPECGFIAKNAGGLGSHRRTHR